MENNTIVIKIKHTEASQATKRYFFDYEKFRAIKLPASHSHTI